MTRIQERVSRPMTRFLLSILLLALSVMPALPAAKKKAKKKTAAPAKVAPVGRHWSLADTKVHRDFPDAAMDAEGYTWIAYIEHDGKADVLKLAQHFNYGIVEVATISKPGVIHHPAVAISGDSIWCFWGQADERDVVSLRARRYTRIDLFDEQKLATSTASDTFADAGVDPAGRVWVTWQSLRRGQSDVYARHLDPKSKTWSDEIHVSKPEGGNWEPKLAFTDAKGAWVVFDSSRGGEFNLFLARVTQDGDVTEYQLTDSPEYEARASISSDFNGLSLWIAAERGRQRWGKDLRGHFPTDGLNGQKRIVLGQFDIAQKKFTEISVPAEGRPTPKPSTTVNLPVVTIHTDGNPLIGYRYYDRTHWNIALIKYHARKKQWTRPIELPDSAFGQDRRCQWVHKQNVAAKLVWPADNRTAKMAMTAGLHLTDLLRLDFEPLPVQPKSIFKLPDPKPYVNVPTPDRPRDDHHVWKHRGKTYRLVWGDVHRHTDFSNCRTGLDGCVVEHFRYAIDIAALDFMGTSDHTDIAKRYDPYEWWQTQKLVDVFYIPGRFNSVYAYEREQRFPWGHRNVVFAQRGGPIVYINRKLYENSQWHALYPTKPGALEITPMELWDVLRKYKKPVAVISHTGATGMGTDWDKYDRIDNTLENVVEIFQGARVSYEALGAPQPTVGLRVDEPYTPSAKAKPDFVKPPLPITDFGKQYNKGVYQRALNNGHKLGVFASSDHTSTHTSFGGVFVEENSRLGIIEGLAARRTIAATDKIFVHLTGNGNELGTIYETTSNPKLEFTIRGTAPIKRVTIVRNETNYKVYEPGTKDFERTFADTEPVSGENRYYLRIEQADGNMAWSSPVWVTVRK